MIKSPLLIILFLFYAINNSFSQTRFNNTYLYQGNDTIDQSDGGHCLLTLSNGEFIIPSLSGATINGLPSQHLLIYKLNSAGITNSLKVYSDSLLSNFEPNAIIRTFDNNCVMVGTYYYKNYSQGAMLCKINLSGDTIFCKIFNTGIISNTFDVIETYDRGLLLVGYTQALGGAGNLNQTLIIKTDSLGNQLWKYQYGASNDYDGASSVVATPDSGALVLAFKQQQGTQNAGVVVYKLDSLGNQEWNQTYSTPNLERGSKIIATKDGNYVIVGSRLLGSTVGSGNAQGFLLKIDPQGNVLWEYNYGDSRNDDFTGLVETSNSDLLVSGNVKQGSMNKGVLKSFNINGDTLWTREFDYNADYNYLNSLNKTFDNGFIMIGQSSKHFNTTPYATLNSIWLVKTDSLGCYVAGCNTVGVANEQLPVINTLSIQPTVFTNQATVYYTIAQPLTNARLDIYTINGTLAKSYPLNPNEHYITISSTNLAQGMHLAMLRTSTGIISTQKIIIQ